MSILYFVELSPDPGPSNNEKKGKKDKKRFERVPQYVPVISSLPPLKAEGSWKINFTADGSSGKAAFSGFPPFGVEESRKIEFTPDGNGGKPAFASFRPLTVEENWKMRVYRPCRQW